MRFFSFNKNSSRAQVAEKKPVNIGLKFDFSPPSDLKNRVQLIPLSQAQAARNIRLRTVVGHQEMTAEVGLWEDTWKSSPSSEDALVQDTASVYSSGSSSSSASEADSSLAPEILDYYVCHKTYSPEDDSMLKLDQSALFKELEDMLVEPVEVKKVVPAAKPIRVVKTVQPQASRQAKRTGIIRFEDTLIPLAVAMNRPDIRFRPEGFEMV